MPKFSLDINGIDQGAAEGREAWAGEIPPTGTYKGILRVVQLQRISENAANEKNRGKPKLLIGVELIDTPGGKFDGYIAYHNLNLIDSSIPYVNQFLLALTDGSDDQFAAIKKAFYPPNGFVLDDRQTHVLSIGKWKINSPKGEIPLLVSVKKRGYVPNGSTETTFVGEVNSFLVGGGGAKGTGGSTKVAEVIEDEAPVVVDEEDAGDDMFAEEEVSADA